MICRYNNSVSPGPVFWLSWTSVEEELCLGFLTQHHTVLGLLNKCPRKRRGLLGLDARLLLLLLWSGQICWQVVFYCAFILRTDCSPSPHPHQRKVHVALPTRGWRRVSKSSGLRSSIHERAAANNKWHFPGQSCLELMGHLMSTCGQLWRLYFFWCARDKSRRRAATLHFQHGVRGPFKKHRRKYSHSTNLCVRIMDGGRPTRRLRSFNLSGHSLRQTIVY